MAAEHPSRLTDEQRKKATAWLDKNWKNNGVCPVCQQAQWQLSDYVVELRSHHPSALLAGGPVYPLFTVTCTTCGHTMLFNAIMAGVIAPDAPAEKLPGVER